jgi:hypothetical protein
MIMSIAKYIMDVSYQKLEYVWMHNLECMSEMYVYVP